MSSKLYAEIAVEGLQLSCRLGVTEEERAVPQRLTASIKMTVDITRAVVTDALSDTISYAEVSAVVGTFLQQSGPYCLLEKLVYVLSEHLFLKFPCEELKLTLQKYPFDMPDVSAVGITLTRTR